MQCVANCDSPDPRKHKTFEQPVIQTLQMFVGESGCWIVVFLSYLYRRYIATSNTNTEDIAYQPVETDETEPLTRRGREDTPGDEEIDPTDAPFKPFVDAESAHHGDRVPLTGWKITLLALPACCDITGTTLMNVGLLFVAASIYQMTRGALVLFVGLMSVIFLKKHLAIYKWASLFVVVLGVAVVGLAGALEKKIPGVPNSDQGAQTMVHLARDVYITAKEHTPAETIIGISLIALAQIFTATQFVLEESRKCFSRRSRIHDRKLIERKHSHDEVRDGSHLRCRMGGHIRLPRHCRRHGHPSLCCRQDRGGSWRLFRRKRRPEPGLPQPSNRSD